MMSDNREGAESRIPRPSGQDWYGRAHPEARPYPFHALDLGESTIGIIRVRSMIRPDFWQLSSSG